MFPEVPNTNQNCVIIHSSFALSKTKSNPCLVVAITKDRVKTHRHDDDEAHNLETPLQVAVYNPRCVITMAQEYPTKTARNKPIMVSEEAATDDEPISNPSKHSGDGDDDDNDKDHPDINSCAANAAKQMARNPCSYFLVALVSTLAVSVVGFIVGDFTVSADNTGWISRGTAIADQTTQILLLNRADRQNNAGDGTTSFSDNEAVWIDLTTNVQDGFEEESTDDEDGDATTAEEEEMEERRFRRQLATMAERQQLATIAERQQLVTVTTRQLQQNTTVVPTGFLACEATSLYVKNSVLVTVVVSVLFFCRSRPCLLFCVY
jgi:hypothetical protein